MPTQNHSFIPEHTLLNDKQKAEILASYHISIRELPKILATDAAVKDLEPNQGDIVKITRESRSAGVSTYYRVIINK
ncbi:DNA-directed RNA polymerase subunit H [archaeon]|nr:DNA-directed RNA polymerase subunit H [archaeon]MBT6761671.1 DNA-directed RNA polymerase subunit H [archaeon]